MSNKILFKNVRVSFPHLFKKPIINGEEGKYGCTIMLDKEANKKEIQTIKDEIKSLAKEHLKGQIPPSSKLCLRDGDDSGREEYAGYMTMSLNNGNAPLVLGSQREVIKDAEDCRIYGGCRVNVKFNLWAQNNAYGKRVNGSLIAIQFAKDDTALDGTHVSLDQAVEGFDDVEDSGDSDDTSFLD